MPGRPIYPDDRLADAYERELLKRYLQPVYDSIAQGIRETRDFDNLLQATADRAFQPTLEDGVPEEQIEDSLRRIMRYHDREMHRTFRMGLGVDVSDVIKDRGEVEAFMRRKIDENISLIVTIPDHLHDDLRRAMERVQIDEGRFIDEQATEELVARIGRSSGYRLRRIVRDQNSKLTGQLTQIRHRQLGITKYRWSSSRDERVRPLHARLNGNVFRWDAEPPDPMGHPGEPIMCRCAAIPVITDKLRKKKDEEKQEAAQKELPDERELERLGYELEVERAYQAPLTDYEGLRAFLERGHADALNNTPLVKQGYVKPNELRRVFAIADETWMNADLEALVDSHSFLSLMFRGVILHRTGTNILNAWRTTDDFARMLGWSRWQIIGAALAAFAGAQLAEPWLAVARVQNFYVRTGRRYTALADDWERKARARAKARRAPADDVPEREPGLPYMRATTPPISAQPRWGYTPRERQEWILERIEQIRHANRRYTDDQLAQLATNEFDKLFGNRRVWVGRPVRLPNETRELWIKRRAKTWMDRGGLDAAEALSYAQMEWSQARWTGWLPIGRLDVWTPPPRYKQADETYEQWFDKRARELRSYNPSMTQRESLRYAKAEARRYLYVRFDPWVNAGHRPNWRETPLRRRTRKQWVTVHARLLRRYNPRWTVRESYVAAQVEWRRAAFAPPVPRKISPGADPAKWLRERAEQLQRFDEERYGDGRFRAQREYAALRVEDGDRLQERPDLGSVDDVSQHARLLEWQSRLVDQYKFELGREMTTAEVEWFVKLWWQRHGVGDIPTVTFASPLLHDGIAEAIGDYELVMWVRTMDDNPANKFRMTRGVLIAEMTSLLMSRLYATRGIADDVPAPRSREYATLLARFYESEVLDPTNVWRVDNGLEFVDDIDVRWARRVARVAAINEYHVSLIDFQDPSVRYLDELAELYAARRKPPPEAETIGVGGASPSFRMGDTPADGHVWRQTRTQPVNPDTPPPPEFVLGVEDVEDSALPGMWVAERTATLQEYNPGMVGDAAHVQALLEFAELYSEYWVRSDVRAARASLSSTTPRPPTYFQVSGGVVVEMPAGVAELLMSTRAQEIVDANPHLSVDAAVLIAEYERLRMVESYGIDPRVDPVPLADYTAGVTQRADWVDAQSRLLLHHDALIGVDDARRLAHEQFDHLIEKHAKDAKKWQDKAGPRPHFVEDEEGSLETQRAYYAAQRALVRLGLVQDRTMLSAGAKRKLEEIWVEAGVARPGRMSMRPPLDIEFAEGTQGLHVDDTIHLLHDADLEEPSTRLSLLLHEVGHALHQRYLLSTSEVPSGAPSLLGQTRAAQRMKMDHSPTYAALMLRLFESHAGLKLKVTRDAPHRVWNPNGRRGMALRVDVSRKELEALGATREEISAILLLRVPMFDLSDIRLNAHRRGMSWDEIFDGVGESPVVVHHLPDDDAARLYGVRNRVNDLIAPKTGVFAHDPYGDLLWESTQESDFPDSGFIEPSMSVMLLALGGMKPENEVELLQVIDAWVDGFYEANGLPKHLHTFARMNNGRRVTLSRHILRRRAASHLSNVSALQRHWEDLGMESGRVPLTGLRMPLLRHASLEIDDYTQGFTFDPTFLNQYTFRMMMHRLRVYNPWLSARLAESLFAEIVVDPAAHGFRYMPVRALRMIEGETYREFVERRVRELSPSMPYENESSMRLWATLEWKGLDGVDMTDVPRTPFDQTSEAFTGGHTASWYSFEDVISIAEDDPDIDRRALVLLARQAGFSYHLPQVYLTIEEAKSFIQRVWDEVGIGDDFEVVIWTPDPDVANYPAGRFWNNRLYLSHDIFGPHRVATTDDEVRVSALTVLHEMSHILHLRLQQMTHQRLKLPRNTLSQFNKAMVENTNHDSQFIGILLHMLDRFHEGADHATLLRQIDEYNTLRIGELSGRPAIVHVDEAVDGVDWARRQAALWGFSQEEILKSRGMRLRLQVSTVTGVHPSRIPPLSARMGMSDAELDELRARIPHLEDKWTRPREPGQDDTEMHPYWQGRLYLFGAEGNWAVPEFNPGDDVQEWVDNFKLYLRDEQDFALDEATVHEAAFLWWAKHYSHKADRDEYFEVRYPMDQMHLNPAAVNRLGIEKHKELYGEPDVESDEYYMLIDLVNRRAAQMVASKADALERRRVPWVEHRVRIKDKGEVEFFDDFNLDVMIDWALPNMPSMEQLGIVGFDPSETDFIKWINDTFALLLELNPEDKVPAARARANHITRVMFAQFIAPLLSVEELRRYVTLRGVGVPTAGEVDEVWSARAAAHIGFDWMLTEEDSRRVSADIFDTTTRGREGRRLAQDEEHRDIQQQSWLYTVQNMIHLWRNRREMHADDMWLTKSEAAAYVEMVWRETGISAPVVLRLAPFTADQLKSGFAGHAYAGEYIEMGYRRGWTPDGISAEKRALAEEEGGIYVDKSTLIHEITHIIMHRAIYSTDDNPLGFIDDTLQSVLHEASINHSETFASLLAHMRYRYYDGIHPDEFKRLAQTIIRYKKRQTVRYFEGWEFVDSPRSYEGTGDLHFNDEVTSHLWARENARKGGMSQESIDLNADRRVVIEHIDAIDTDYDKREGPFISNRTNADGSPRRVYEAGSHEYNTVRVAMWEVIADEWDQDKHHPSEAIQAAYVKARDRLPDAEWSQLLTTAEDIFASDQSKLITYGNLRRMLSPDTVLDMPLPDERTTRGFSPEVFDAWWVGRHELNIWRANVWMSQEVAGELAREDIVQSRRAILRKRRQPYANAEWGWTYRPFGGEPPKGHAWPIESAVDVIEREAASLKEQFPGSTEQMRRQKAVYEYWLATRAGDPGNRIDDDWKDPLLEGGRDPQQKSMYAAEAIIRAEMAATNTQSRDVARARTRHGLPPFDPDDPQEFKWAFRSAFADNPDMGVWLGSLVGAMSDYNIKKGASMSGGMPPTLVIRRRLSEESRLAGVQSRHRIAILPQIGTDPAEDGLLLPLDTMYHEMGHWLSWVSQGEAGRAGHAQVFAGIRKRSFLDRGVREKAIDDAYAKPGAQRFESLPPVDLHHAAVDPDYVRNQLRVDENPSYISNVADAPQVLIDESLRPYIYPDMLPENVTWAILEDPSVKLKNMTDDELWDLMEANGFDAYDMNPEDLVDETPGDPWIINRKQRARWDKDLLLRLHDIGAIDTEYLDERLAHLNRVLDSALSDTAADAAEELLPLGHRAGETADISTWKTVRTGGGDTYLPGEESSAHITSMDKDAGFSTKGYAHVSAPPSIRMEAPAVFNPQEPDPPKYEVMSAHLPGGRVLRMNARVERDTGSRVRFGPGAHTTYPMTEFLEARARRREAGDVGTEGESSFQQSRRDAKDMVRQSTYSSWLMRVRTVDDLDELETPTRDEIRRTFHSDLHPNRHLEYPIVVSSLSDMRAAAVNQDKLVFDELRVPAGTFFQSPGDMRMATDEITGVSTDIATEVLISRGHKVSLVAEYEDVWIVRRAPWDETSGKMPNAKFMASIKDLSAADQRARIIEAFPQLAYVDRYRVWSIDADTVLPLRPRGLGVAPRALPQGVGPDDLTDAEIDKRAMVAMFATATKQDDFTEYMMPGYELPEDASDEVKEAAEAGQAKLDHHRRISRIEARYIASELMGEPELLPLPKAEPFAWPTPETAPEGKDLGRWYGRHKLRFSRVWDSNRQTWMPDGFVSHRLKTRLLKQLTWPQLQHPITEVMYDGPELNHSTAIYTIIDEVTRIDKEVRDAGGFAVKTDRSPDAPTDVALRLRDANYDRNKLRTFAHITGDQYTFMKIDEDFETPFGYPEHLRALFDRRVYEAGRQPKVVHSLEDNSTMGLVRMYGTEEQKARVEDLFRGDIEVTQQQILDIANEVEAARVKQLISDAKESFHKEISRSDTAVRSMITLIRHSDSKIGGVDDDVVAAARKALLDGDEDPAYELALRVAGRARRRHVRALLTKQIGPNRMSKGIIPDEEFDWLTYEPDALAEAKASGDATAVSAQIAKDRQRMIDSADDDLEEDWTTKWDEGDFFVIAHRYPDGKVRMSTLLPNPDPAAENPYVPFLVIDDGNNLVPLEGEYKDASDAMRRAGVESLRKHMEEGGRWYQKLFGKFGTQTNVGGGGRLAELRYGDMAGFYVMGSQDERTDLRTTVMKPHRGSKTFLFALEMANRPFSRYNGPGFHAWRGLRLPDEAFESDGIPLLEAYSSSSIDYSQAEGFADSRYPGNETLMVVEYPNGSIASMFNVSETEVVLPSGTRFDLLYEEKNVLIRDSILNDPDKRLKGFDYVQYVRVVPDEITGDGFDLDPALDGAEAIAARIAELKGKSEVIDGVSAPTTDKPIKVFDAVNYKSAIYNHIPFGEGFSYAPYLMAHLAVDFSAKTRRALAAASDEIEVLPLVNFKAHSTLQGALDVEDRDTMFELHIPAGVELTHDANADTWSYKQDRHKGPAFVMTKLLTGDKIPQEARDAGIKRYYILEFKPEADAAGYKRDQ